MNKDLIKCIRQKAILTQQEFAKELNISLMTLYRWEIGKNKPSYIAQRKILEFCKNHNIDLEKIAPPSN